MLTHCNVVNNHYQHDSRVLCTFAPNKLFGQLLNISPETFMFLKIFDLEFSCIEVWFTDQSSKVLEMEDKTNINLIINYNVKYKKWRDTQFNIEILLEIWAKKLVKINW